MSSCSLASRVRWEEVVQSAAWDGFVNYDSIYDFKLHYTAATALYLVPWLSVGYADRVFIFTNGSGGDGAGCAFSIIGEDTAAGFFFASFA